MKMKYCSYCGSRLDETTGVCPKCYGGMDAPKQEEQTSELTSVPKVDLGDSPFATVPSTVIPTLTLDPFGASAAQETASQVQLEFGNVSQTSAESASGPQLVMSETQKTPQAGPAISLELKPGISVQTEEPVREEQTQMEAPSQAEPETSAESDVFKQTPPAYSPKAQTKFEEMVAKIQADQERMKNEQIAGQQQGAQQTQQQPQPTQQPAQQPYVPQPMQAPQTSFKENVPQPMQAPTYGQPHPQQSAQYTPPQATQYTQAQTAQNAQYGQQAPTYGRQYAQPQAGPYAQPQAGQYTQPQAGQYGQQYGQPYAQPQPGQYMQPNSYGMQGNPNAPYGMQGDGSASPEAVNAYMKSQKPANYANPAYVDQEVMIDTQYGQNVDPRFSQTVNMNMQYNQAQAPVLYQQQNVMHPPGAPIPSIESKNRVTAGVLAIVLGQFGAHKFYMNHPSAIWYVLITLFTCGLGGTVMWVISLIEGIGYLGMSDEEFKQKLYDEFYKTQQ